MSMGAHAAPFVRGPSSPLSSSPPFLVILLALWWSTYTVVVIAVVLDSTAESLLKFKSALANADEALSSWNTSTTPCSGNHANWRGVLCFNGNVWGLQLENMNLSGQIDVDSLAGLPFLRALSFMNNNFQGPMPDWRKLGALKSLYLSNNHFSGQIPDDAFKGMLSLKKLYLANNDFTGNMPSSLATPRLLELSLDNNQFTGPIQNFPPGIKMFNVSNNLLEGPIPPSLTKMDPSSFAGNKGLCGKPLGPDCSSENIPPDDESSPSQSPTPTSDQPFSPPPSATTTNETSATKIVTIVLCALVALAAIIVIILLCFRSRRDKQQPVLGHTTSFYNAQKNWSPPEAAAAAAAAASSHQDHVVVDSATTTPQSDISSATAKARKAESGKLLFVREDRERFDLQDLLRASAEVLGSGNFGSSYKATLMNGQALVVKRFKQMNNVDKEDFHEHMRRVARLSHPNLLPLVAYYYRKEEKLLVFDYMYNGSLASRLYGKPGLDWPSRLKIIKGVGKGLMYLHEELRSLMVPHGHLKSSNVVLDKAFNPLLMDYSLVPVVNPDQVTQLLVAYKSPEYTRRGQITKKTDVWCLGILILEILTGKLPPNCLAQSSAGYDSNLAGWINSIIREDQEDGAQVFDNEMGSSTENCWGEMRKLLQIGAACCQEDPDKRWDLKVAVDKIEELRDIDH